MLDSLVSSTFSFTDINIIIFHFVIWWGIEGMVTSERIVRQLNFNCHQVMLIEPALYAGFITTYKALVIGCISLFVEMDVQHNSSLHYSLLSVTGSGIVAAGHAMNVGLASRLNHLCDLGLLAATHISMKPENI